MSMSSVRIGAYGGYYGDRRGAMGDFRDEKVDFLIADYLAELTMLVLGKNMERGKVGYADGFVEELRASIGWIAQQGVTVVTNAGGLDPVSCAQAIRQVCREEGVDLPVAAVHGDNLKSHLLAEGRNRPLLHLDTGEPLPVDVDEIITANAYLGAGGVVAAIDRGARIVVTGRVTDAVLVLAPAMAHFGWAADDYDALAGGVAVGHAIECGAQATGGSYAFFDREGDLGLPGMPIAEVFEDGSSVVTKVSGTGGVVNTDTVLAQMVYEVTSGYYHNPDVVVDWNSIELHDLGDDRVKISGVRGLVPTSTTKLSLSYHGGYRNQMTLGMTGLNQQKKLRWITDQLHDYLGDESTFEAFDISVIGGDQPDPDSYGTATAWAIVAARDSNRERVGRAEFSDRIVELGISSIPGLYFTTPPSSPRQIGVQWPCLVPKADVPIRVDLEDEHFAVPWGPSSDEPLPEHQATATEPVSSIDHEPWRTMPLGELIGARSGDKAGVANLGVWAQTDEAWTWLRSWLTTECLESLLPEVKGLGIQRYEFPKMRAMNFVIQGFLDRGVSQTLRFDPQAKGLGEYLRAKVVPIPEALADQAGRHARRD